MAFVLPIALVVVSNIIYHICAKSMPSTLNPFASLTVTYLVGAVISAVLYFVFNKGANIVHKFTHLNWTPFALGIAIVGLEAGFIYAYKAGWLICTPKVRYFWWCIFLWEKEKTKNTRQNIKRNEPGTIPNSFTSKLILNFV